ncbi:hypothetical protein [Hoeflea sp.]|uniref:hypothetical protein n=1 Tax=Hoeflea sp. TaxID=1940281 RepID=UPI003A8F5ACC
MELVVAIIGSIFGFIIGSFAQAYLTYLQQKLAAINDHLKDIEEVRDAAFEYWRRSHECDEQKYRAARLKGLMFGVLEYREKAAEILGGHEEGYSDLIRTLYDQTTGGDFEGAKQMPDTRRISMIFTTAAEISLHLRHVRPKFIWYN